MKYTSQSVTKITTKVFDLVEAVAIETVRLPFVPETLTVHYHEGPGRSRIVSWYIDGSILRADGSPGKRRATYARSDLVPRAFDRIAEHNAPWAKGGAS